MDKYRFYFLSFFVLCEVFLALSGLTFYYYYSIVSYEHFVETKISPIEKYDHPQYEQSVKLNIPLKNDYFQLFNYSLGLFIISFILTIVYKYFANHSTEMFI